MFFSWKNLYKKYPFLKDAQIVAACGPRNIGKSYDTYLHVEKDRKGFRENHKVAILRNTDKEVQTARQDFNNRFLNKYKCFGNHIYSLKQTFIEKDDEQIEIFVKDKLVGYIAAISTYTNLKSIEAKDIKTIIYEEFNEDTSIGRNIYPQFINIITTLIRFSKCKIFMLGNKDGFMSDFYINWNIIPQQQNDDDVVYPIGDFGFWIELGNKDYEDLGNQNTIFYKLAMMDNRTKSYLQGGYIHGLSTNVKNYNEIIVDFEPKFYIAYMEQKYVFGKWKDKYSILSPWNYDTNKSLKTYSVDLISRLMNESKILDDDDMKDVVEFLLKNIKSQNIVFDSYDTLQKFKDLTLWLKILD